MRKILLSVLMLYGSMAIAQIDAASVPANVQKSVKAKYASAQVLDWYQVDEGYEASLDMDGESVSAVFGKDGKFLHTYTVVSEEDLPESMVNGLYEKYEDAYIAEALKLERPDGVQYRVTVEAGEKALLLTYDKSGKVINSKELESDF